MRIAWTCLLALAACGGAPAAADGPTPGRPPPLPAASDSVAPSTTTLTYAVDAWLLGDIARNAVSATTDAWRGFGYDLDHRATTKVSTDVCTLSIDAPPMNQVDGDVGIDNAWGSQLLPLLETLLGVATPSDTVTAAIGSGASTFELAVTGLPDDASASAIGLTASAFVAAPVASDPFDMAVSRPVTPASVADGATFESGARVRFDGAWVNAGTFVSGASTAPLVVELTVNGQLLSLTIKAPIVTFVRTREKDAVSGTIAGVLDTDALVASSLAIGKALSSTICKDPTTFDAIADEIRQARDILDDGSNHAGTACTGISIGLGFHARRVGNPSSVAPDAQPPSLCP